MLSRKLHIKKISNNNFVKQKQENYSYAFHKLYRHIDKVSDKSFVEFLCDEFDLNEIEFRSLVVEVMSKFAKTKVIKKKTEEEVIDIEDEITKIKKEKLSKKNTRTLFKLNKSLQYKNKSLSKDITFGGKALLRVISHLHNQKDYVNIVEKKREYTKSRILPIFIMGEANQKGNRFFSFDLLNNKIIYKPKKGIKIEIEFACYHSYKKDLESLQILSDNKSISISVMLSEDNISLIFDDAVMHGYALDIKGRKAEVSNIKQKKLDKETTTLLIKEVYTKYYKKLERQKLFDKNENRYLAIDTNPDFIGCSILERVKNEAKVIHTFYYDLTQINKKLHKTSSPEFRQYINEKRKNGICHIWKDIFRVAKYYGCGSIITEDLELEGKKLDNKESNRKVKNIWHRELSTKLINKYCNKNGIIQITINPCYSSFIGNILNDYIDPVNASIEIGRRGIFKFIKEKFYPEFNASTIMNAMDKYPALRDVSCLKDCHSWVEMYKIVQESGLRYRAILNDVKYKHHVVQNLIHGKIKKICFSSENCLSLTINS